MDSEDFLKAETRSEFYVDEKRKKLWKIELDMLEIVQEICKKNSINYFLHSGSALGAVRHNGFIPWDDDLDLGMLRNDFQRFVSACEKELKPPFFLQYGLNDGGHVCGLLRIRNSNTTAIIRNDEDKDCNNGVYLEIYPFDNIPDALIPRKIQFFLSLFFYHGLLANYYGPASKRQWFARIVIQLLGSQKAFSIWQKICQKYNNRNTKYIDTVSLPDYARKGIYRIKCNWIHRFKEVPYEYLTVSIPESVDAMLKLNYGNYWELPKPEERGIEHTNIVFFDPDKPYSYYKDSDLVHEYFHGNN